MKTMLALGGGLAGACALTLLHEGAKRIDPDAPKLDALAKNAIVNTLKGMNKKVPGENKLFSMALVGDILGNAIYYSKIAGGSKKQVWLRGTMLGLGAGLGAVYLPKQFGLNEEPSNKSNKTKLMTVALYLLGGLAAAAAINAMESKNEKELPDTNNKKFFESTKKHAMSMV